MSTQGHTHQHVCKLPGVMMSDDWEGPWEGPVQSQTYHLQAGRPWSKGTLQPTMPKPTQQHQHPPSYWAVLLGQCTAPRTPAAVGVTCC
jgi:hypothetical protein